jgi:5-methylcytosine-specific restriction endonuclease McrA
MSRVLVLNATYEPLNVVSLRRAVLLLLKEKAEIVEAAEAWLHAERLALPVPLVIRLVYYVRIPQRFSLPLSRRTVLARDHYTCQYCFAQPGRARLTIDHILPRSRGGETRWDNIVTACEPCNRRKGDRTPEEARMPLLRLPRRPRYLALTVLEGSHAPQAWDKYMYF